MGDNQTLETGGVYLVHNTSSGWLADLAVVDLFGFGIGIGG
jgi:hypothetical protein